MSECEPGHDWQLEAESASWVKYRCTDCGSRCMAPKPVPEREPLTVARPGQEARR